MASPDPERAIRQELHNDERILWAGKPALWHLFGGVDVFLVAFGLAYVGWGIQWTIWSFREGFDFVVIDLMMVFLMLFGLYTLANAFVFKPLVRKRTHYAVTNRRILILKTFPRASLAATYIDAIPSLTKELQKRGRGTIGFGDHPMWRGGEGSPFGNPFAPALPALVNVSDVEHVYALIESLRRNARATA